MKVLFACICDHASAEQNGKLSVHGIFDRIHAKDFPARHPRMYLAYRLLFDYEDNDKQNRLDIALLDQDGRPLLDAKGELRHGKVAPGGFQTFNQIIEFNDLVLANPGRYTFVLKADGQEAFSVPFEVVKQRSQG